MVSYTYYDGGSRPFDFFIVTFLSTFITATIIVNIGLFSSMNTIALRAKSLPLVTIQTIGGTLWFIGFSVRYGHFDSPPDSILADCDLWWFWIGMNGFGIWCSCILLRLVRLYVIFILGKPFQIDWKLILFGIWSPFLLYCIIGTYIYAVAYIAAIKMCLYRSSWFGVIDSGIVFIFFGILSFLVRKLRTVKDLLGENNSIRKAMTISFSLWTATFIICFMELDSFWFGRAFVTASISISVICFFFIQNIESLEHLILKKNRELEERIRDAILNPRNQDDDILPISSSEKIESKKPMVSGHLKQRMFSEAIFGKEKEIS